jgi:hypothetical protein
MALAPSWLVRVVGWWAVGGQPQLVTRIGMAPSWLVGVAGGQPQLVTRMALAPS